MTDATETPAAVRRGGWWRRLAGWLLFLLLLLLVLLQGVYLLRKPLLEPLLRRTVAGLLGDALGGSASVARIDGDWLTHVTVQGLSLSTGGVLREVRDATIDVRLDPLALLRADLGGLRRLHVHATALYLDLDAPAGDSAPPSEGAGPPDLAPLLALLPDGAEITVDALTVAGQHQRRTGRARIRLVPGTGSTARRALVDGPGLTVAATLQSDGRLAAELALADVAGVPQLFTPLDLFAGGEAEASVVLQLVPAFALDANLRVRGLRVRGRPVQTMTATGHVDSDGLSRLSVDLTAPGVILRASDAALRYDDALASLQGDVALDLKNLEPYVDLLPEAARDQLPIRGSLRAHAGGGRIEVGYGLFTCQSGDLRLDAGAVTIDGRPGLVADVPLRAHLRLQHPDRLPLPADLPLRPLAGGLDVRLGSRDGALALDLDIDLGIADADGRTGRLHGSVAAGFGAATTVAPRLSLQGDVLRGAAERAAVHGELALEGQALQIAALGVDLDDHVDAVAVRGRLPLAATAPADLLAQGDIAVTFARLPLHALVALAPAGPQFGNVKGELTGSASCRSGAIAVDLRATVNGLPTLPDDAMTTLLLQTAFENGVLTLTQLAVETPVGNTSLRGTAAGLDVAALLAGAFDRDHCELELAAEFAFTSLQRLRLADLVAIDLRGDVRGRADLRGTAASPLASAELEATDVAVANAAGTLVQDLGVSLKLTDRTLRIDDLHGRVFDQPIGLGGELSATGSGFAVRGLRLADAGGGTLTIDGTLGGVVDGDWRAALRGADLRVEGIGLQLDPWLALAGQPATGARADTTLRWQPEATPALQLRVLASADRLAVGGDLREARFAFTVEGDRDATRITALQVTSGELQISGAGNIALAPLAALDDPQRLRDATVALDLTVPTTDLSTLPAMALGFAQLTGRLGATVHLKGTIAKPEPSATIDLAEASLVTSGGQRLDDLEARIELSPTAARIERLRAMRGRGPIEIAGTFTAPGPLWRDWRTGELDLTIDGTDVLVHRRAGVKVRAGIALRVHGPLADFSIAGDVKLHDAKAVMRIPLLDLSHTGGRAATAGIVIPGVDLGPGIGAHLNVNIATTEPFQVTNNVVDGRFEVQLALQGPLSQPVLEGTISGPEAQLILPGMRLRASTLLVEFRRDDPRFPVVTATANGRRHGYDVQVVVRGRYDRPQILMSSTPPLPPDDLVVLVTTGARPDALRSTSGVSTVLGTYLAQELADWIFGSESTEAKESFLDRFTIESGAEMSKAGTESVVVEFRLLDSVYLQGERDVYEDLNMGVVYRLKFR